MGIRSWFRNWLNEDLYAVESKLEPAASGKYHGIHPIQKLEHERAIRLTIYSAAGGRIIETNRFDVVKDRSYNNLYIITEEKDFGKEIEKILTMEALRS